METTITKRRWFRRTALIAVPLGLCLGVVIVGILQARPILVKSFTTCAAYGFPVVGTQPQICTADGKTFEGPYIPARIPLSTTLEYSTLYSENGPGSFTEKNQIITSQADWKDYWMSVHTNPTAVSMLPPVDFSKQTVVAVSMGNYRSTAVGIRVLSIVVTPQDTVVTIQESKPGETCSALALTSNPTLAIAFAKQKTPVRIEVKVKSQQCGQI